MSEAVTIDKNQRLSYALDLLERKKVDRLVVTDGSSVQGIVTYADIADRLSVSKVVAVSTGRLHVSSVMTEPVISVAPDEDVSDVARLMVDRGMSGCPVIDKNGMLVGMVTKREIIQLANKFGHIKVKDIMTSEMLLTANPSERLIKVRADMLGAGYSGVPVVDGTRVLGLVTEKSVAEAMARFSTEVPDKYRSNQVRNLRVVDAMIQQPPVVSQDDSLPDAVKKLTESGLNTLPVVDREGRLVGIISSTDITRFIANKFKVP